jgi:hypothetical protein
MTELRLVVDFGHCILSCLHLNCSARIRQENSNDKSKQLRPNECIYVATFEALLSPSHVDEDLNMRNDVLRLS